MSIEAAVAGLDRFYNDYSDNDDNYDDNKGDDANANAMMMMEEED